MTALLASVGWGLLAIGAITHVWHHARLRQLLGMHLDNERVPALALTSLELVLAVGIPIAWLTSLAVLPVLALIGAALALGFVVWITRLLLTKSELPCACSFSEAPTTVWSLGRACMVALVALFAVTGEAGTTSLTTAEAIASMAVGLALAAAVYVLPEAVSWPEASRALLARVDAYDADATPS